MTFATTTISPATTRFTYQQTRARYEANPADPAAVRSMGWALAGLLKDVSGAADVQPHRMLKGLATLAAFPMDADETRWRTSVLWSVNRFLLHIRPEQLPLDELAQLVRQSRSFLPPEPSLERSVWWKALLRHSATGVDWLGLFDELGWDGMFRPEDETGEQYGDGKKAGPLLEGLLGAVARQLMQCIPLTDELAAPWLDRFARLTEQHPDWQFIAWHHAKLLLRLGRTEEAMAVFLPFARRKQHDFWVWGMLADLLPESAVEQQLACYGRALSLKTPEPFLVKIRQRLAGLLIRLHRWNEARVEIDRLVQTRQQENWSTPGEVLQWMNDDHYTHSIPAVENWYGQGRELADALLWADRAPTVVLVTGTDPTGTYCNFALDERMGGSFPCRRFGLNVSTGDRLAIRYESRLKNGRPHLHVLAASVTLAACTHLQSRTVTGPLRQPPGRPIGFVDDVLVPADVLSTLNEVPDQPVVVEAVSAWDKAKKKTGWRAFRIATIS